jgi:antitoxin component YwqK of YwqJK toxin-antitoxin module
MNMKITKLSDMRWIFESWYANGNPSMRCEWKNIEVPHTHFTKTGDISMKTTEYLPVRDGSCEVWSEKGNCIHCQMFKKGLRDGLEVGFYESGQISYICNWIKDDKDGIEEHFFENGQIKYRVACTSGKKDGLEELWDENGILVYRCYWKNANLIKREEGPKSPRKMSVKLFLPNFSNKLFQTS